MVHRTNDVWLHYPRKNTWLKFSRPAAIITARRIAEVIPALTEVERAIQSGCYAAGFLSYEAAAAFDAAFTTRAASDFPLLWFGIYGAPAVVTLPAIPDPAELDWRLDTDRAAYGEALAAIRVAIARGDTYQVNYTIRQTAAFDDDPFALFCRMAGGVPYGAFIDLPEWTICSASPELFFDKRGSRLTARPMKGTAPRGHTRVEDDRNRMALRSSVKDRAENAMITDMLRNDIGRFADFGSVRVSKTFLLEKYPTVWQMTSTVTGRSRAGIGDTLRALFPCASITGAPKISTMKLISALETAPRNIYTGAIGFITPAGDAQFNVAIRTALVDRRRGRVEYGIGSGVVWDSRPDAEYEECLLKAKVMTRRPWPERFSLLSSLRWDPEEGIFLVDDHLKRLRDSAAYFDFRYDAAVVRKALEDRVLSLPSRVHKLRLLLNREGRVSITAVPVDLRSDPPPLKATLARTPVSSEDIFLYHKTTQRATYENARPAVDGCDALILWNERGEVTEATLYNVVAKIRGQWVTPPVSSGLLGGVYRQQLLAQGKIEEGLITLAALRAAEDLALINAVRGWRMAQLVTG